MPPVIIAHRTSPLDAPENSLEGIRRSAELGADYVEIDVRLTRDGVPVMLHDGLLLRTTLASVADLMGDRQGAPTRQAAPQR